jgi:DNA topoisomerase-1
MKRVSSEGEETPKKKLKHSKWWEEQLDEPSTTKWESLEHNGVTFPPLYELHSVPLLYEGQPVPLNPEQEEVASWWAAVVGTDWETKPIMRKNFEVEFLRVLGSDHPVKSLDKCDFSNIVNRLAQKREEKKNIPPEVKKADREVKDRINQIFGYAVVDGVLEKISNHVVEPPGLFRGRGEHPKAGMLKTRLSPEDVTINIGKSNKVPKCPLPGHNWKNVVHNDTVTWLGYYKDPNLSFSNVKYVYLSAASKFKGMNDKFKYEKARKLKELVDGIRQDYVNKIRSPSETEKQLGTALYLIDKLALRVGNEKSEDEADTVGCCSLRVAHISFEPDFHITLDFLGKDSMRYFNTVKVDEEVFANLQSFTKAKRAEDDLFDRISPTTLNDYLKSFMPGLSAKVFRTFNASFTLQQELNKYVPANHNVDEKVQFYTDANRHVAILCNHQKSTPKNFEVQMEKMQEKLKEKLNAMNDLEEHLRTFRGKSKEPPKNDKKLPVTEESTRKAIVRAMNQIKTMELRLKMKDENKTVALGTSKINYMDPRITVSWCKENEVPIEKIFPKTLRDKFMWAMYVEPSWKF